MARIILEILEKLQQPGVQEQGKFQEECMKVQKECMDQLKDAKGMKICISALSEGGPQFVGKQQSST